VLRYDVLCYVMLCYVTLCYSQFEKALSCVKEAEELNASLPLHAPSPSLSSGAGTGAESSGTSLPSDPSGSHSASTRASSLSVSSAPSGQHMLHTTISRETFVFARFSIQCRSGDIPEAAVCLRELIVEASSFDMALNALVMFLQGSGVISAEQGNAGEGRDVQSESNGAGPPKRGVHANGSASLAALQYLDFFQLLGEKFSR
jgi:hypothetical protein